MTVKFWDGSTDGNWGTDANWQLENGGATVAPIAADDVRIDGRTTQDIDAGLTGNEVSLATLIVFPSYLGSIGTSAQGLEMSAATGTFVLEGQGDYYFECGDGLTNVDTTIMLMVINLSGPTNIVGLSCSANNPSNNGEFTTVIVNKGTLTIFGDADNLGEAGCWVANLIIQPTKGRTSNVTVNVGDDCEDLNNGTLMDIEMQNGTLNQHSRIQELDQSGGTVNFGSTAYTMDTGNDNIALLNLRAGTFNWLPSVVAASIRTTASASPLITELNIYGGTFSATDMLETITTAPTITLLRQFVGSTFDIENGYANFVVTTYVRYGGELRASAGQALSFV